MYRQYRQRGFSLVELGIILAVVGLLLGASLVPLGELWRSDSQRNEENAFRIHQNSILGYALTHSTVEREVVVANAAGVSRTYRIPAGRPYLPCPDVDGDGYEDRVGAANAGVFIPVAVTTGYSISPPVPPATNANDLLIHGNCLLSRGILPWKTLGVAAADTWGNRYTYQVDDVFSNAVVGFNQDTVADSFDYRLTVTLDTNGRSFYQRRSTATNITVQINAMDFTFRNTRRPIVICGADEDELCQSKPMQQLFLEAGSMATVAFSGARRLYGENDVIEGVVYAVVSHGNNRHGAVNHHANTVANQVRCNEPLYNQSASASRETLDDYLRHEAVNLPFIEQALPDNRRYCPPLSIGATMLQDGFFVHRPRGRVTAGAMPTEYDDIVSWKLRQEIFQALTRARVLPAQPLPLFRPY